jgi:serine protease inhibitor ecotin
VKALKSNKTQAFTRWGTGGFFIDKSFAPLSLMMTYPNFVTDLVGHYL